MTMKLAQRILVMLIVVCGGFHSSALARPTAGTNGPYCGIMAVYSAALLFDKTVAFEDLLSPTYVSSFDGSTRDELIAAAKHLGLHARSYDGVSLGWLRKTDRPFILHVKSTPESDAYDHWILVTAGQGTPPVVVDSGTTQRADFGALETRWDGLAIVLSDSDLSQLNPPIVPGGWAGEIAAMCALGVCVASQLVRPTPILAHRRIRSIVRFAAVISIATVFGFGYHAVAAYGFFRQPDAVRSLQLGQSGALLAKIEFDDVAQLSIDPNKALIVDARVYEDYTAGHVPHAMSVQTRASDARLKEVVRRGAGRTIVVYCQSSGCPFSRQVASNLILHGATDVTIYKGGWVDWTDRSGQIEKGFDASLHPVNNGPTTKPASSK